jgi:hypothetical protein
MMAAPSACRIARMAAWRFSLVLFNLQNITAETSNTVPIAAEIATYSPVIITHTLFLLVSYHPESPLQTQKGTGLFIV